MNKKKMSSHAWYKIFVYVAMIVFAISIIVPVAWVFLSSVKSQLDLVGDPWSMPTQFLWSNFVDAMERPAWESISSIPYLSPCSV